MGAKLSYKTIMFFGMAFAAISFFQTSAKAATLSLTPASGQIVVGTAYNLDIYLDMASDNIDGYALKINYDDSKAMIDSVTPSTIFIIPWELTYDGGIIIFHRSLGPYEAPPTGNVLLATIGYHPIQTGTLNFTFDQTTLVSGTIDEESGQHITTTLSGSTFTVQDAPSQSNTPTPTPTLTSSATTTPSPTGTLPKTGIIDDLAGKNVFLGLALMVLGVFGFVEFKRAV